MSNFFEVENDSGKQTVYVPNGDAINAEEGIIVKLIKNVDEFVELLNSEYGRQLLHYQDESKIDVSRLVIRVVQKYLKGD